MDPFCPIRTIPNYFENGLRSRSDPGVAFGPVLKNGTFSYANGSRLYYATLATNLTDTRIERGGINSTTAITVSHIDNLTPAGVADQSNWSKPYFVPANISASAGLDKEQVWADNAATSPFFGRVYVCYTDFHSFSRDPAATGHRVRQHVAGHRECLLRAGVPVDGHRGHGP